MDMPFCRVLEGREIGASFKRVTVNATAKIEDYVGPAVDSSQREPGMAMMAALIGCVDKLYIDGEEVPVASIGTGPNYEDEETGETLTELLLGEVLRDRKNRRQLLKVARPVFERFVPEDANPVADLKPIG